MSFLQILTTHTLKAEVNCVLCFILVPTLGKLTSHHVVCMNDESSSGGLDYWSSIYSFVQSLDLAGCCRYIAYGVSKSHWCWCHWSVLPPTSSLLQLWTTRNWVPIPVELLTRSWGRWREGKQQRYQDSAIFGATLCLWWLICWFGHWHGFVHR